MRLNQLRRLLSRLLNKPEQTSEEDTGMNYLVAGLGNIGAEYASTRHNMGFMVLDAWAQALNVTVTWPRFHSKDGSSTF